MAKNNLNHRIFTLNCKGRILLIDQPAMMGIMNITPDSFYTGSRFTNLSSILKQVEKMLKKEPISLILADKVQGREAKEYRLEEELARVIPAIEA